MEIDMRSIIVGLIVLPALAFLGFFLMTLFALEYHNEPVYFTSLAACVVCLGSFVLGNMAQYHWDTQSAKKEGPGTQGYSVHLRPHIFLLCALALSVASCSPKAFNPKALSINPKRVDVVTKMDTWGAHHGRALVGPRLNLSNGGTVELLAGGQTALYYPDEPHNSTRAPRDEFMAQFECSWPVWSR